MWQVGGLLLALLVQGLDAGDAVVEQQQSVTPVQKVVNLLTRLRERVQEEGKVEAINYDKFSCFCKEQSSNKKYEIERSKVKTDGLEAAISDLSSQVAQLDSDVVSRRSDIETEKTAASEAATARSAAAATFEQQRTDLVQAVQAAESALKVLQISKDAASGKAAPVSAGDGRVLMQLAKKAPPQVRQVLLASARAARENPTTYDFRSNDILDTVRELMRSFKAQLAILDEDNAKASHTYNLVEGARANKVSSLQKEVDEKERSSALKGEEIGSKRALLAQETAARTSDEAFLADLTTQCEAKAKAWDDRSKTRASEIQAITDALGLLQGADKVYSANKKLVGLASSSQAVTVSRHATSVQGTPTRRGVGNLRGGLHKAVAFLQLSPGKAGAVSAAVGLLDRHSTALRSAALAALMVQVRLGEDHFERVRGLIKDLLARLAGEAAEEATQKSFCDDAMKSAVGKRDEQRAQVEALQGNIATATSQIAGISGEISALGEEIAGLYKALNEMTELRTNEKAANEKTVADATEGAEAVKKAIEVLKKFYEPGLLQQSRYTPNNADKDGVTVSDLAPATFDDDYKGKTAESKGILGLLDVIGSDFDRTSAQTAASEATAAADFQQESQKINTQIDEKKAMLASKESDKELKQSSLTGFEDSLQDASKLHAVALEELEKLSASCVDRAESYEERQKHREQEVDALKQALQILEDWKR